MGQACCKSRHPLLYKFSLGEGDHRTRPSYPSEKPVYTHDFYRIKWSFFQFYCLDRNDWGRNRRDHQEERASITVSLLQMTTAIITSFVRNNHVDVEQLPDLIRSVHTARGGVAVSVQERPADKPKPATPITKSVHEGFIICLEDGEKLKMLRRYLMTNFDLKPDEYRRRWNIPADYPMVAPSDARRRSEFAKKSDWAGES